MPEPVTPTSTPPAATAPVPASDPTNIPPAAGATPPAEPAPQTPAAPPAPARPDGVSDTEWTALGDPGKAALVRERQAREAAEAQVRDHQRAQMSELERAQAEATESREAAAKATTEALRWRLAARHGISDDDAELFLTGADEATLTAQAERVAARLSGQQPTPRTPAPDPGQGARPTHVSSEDDQTYESLYGAQTRK